MCLYVSLYVCPVQSLFFMRLYMYLYMFVLSGPDMQSPPRGWPWKLISLWIYARNCIFFMCVSVCISICLSRPVLSSSVVGVRRSHRRVVDPGNLYPFGYMLRTAYFLSWFVAIRALLFWTIWCHSFWNLMKIERLTQFPKKTPPPPLFSDIFQFSTISDFFFEKKQIAQFFSDYKKEGSKLFRRAIPL